MGYLSVMEKLATYLKERKAQGHKKYVFAADVGITKAYLSQLLSGAYRPSYALMLRIEAATGGAVTPNDWRYDVTEPAE